MEFRLNACTLLCELVVLACLAWTNSSPLPRNMKDELKKLKSTIHLTNLTETERQEGGSIFKKQLLRMERLNKTDNQKLLVLEILSVYSRLFHKMSKKNKQGSQVRHKEAEYLQEKVQELLMLDNGNELVEMQHTIRDYEWNSVELMKALNDFPVVYDKAIEVLKKQNQKPCEKYP